MDIQDKVVIITTKLDSSLRCVNADHINREIGLALRKLS